MNKYLTVNLAERPDLRMQAAEWFHRKWDIPTEEYLSSIDECLDGNNDIPQWYVTLADHNTIIGGIGLIENDFHLRKELTPNVCALYVEEEFRNQGIARQLLERVCRDMKKRSLASLYLVTEHTAFYERYGWSFFGMVQEESGDMIRMYKKDL
ncbi:MAG TPA: GNAT family N-acetyltransferase [Candidatus Bacteroides avicola]|uniref:GNAT family N-acetyltransferase n=1 Tax=Candidatus Bacteroides avicola TaxID=2838468 RepID=A0A9D2HZJ5_9BACE|nr:GNAT family N-acetyltransferase [Mediterranea sp. An20]OUP06171.1 GNAT family N-acetyltransferase [Mediterranea sp. An20]HJA86933.1 GNAT family N-acetyltransferase [Candidatus Bacteroides avicola]